MDRATLRKGSPAQEADVEVHVHMKACMEEGMASDDIITNFNIFLIFFCMKVATNDLIQNFSVAWELSTYYMHHLLKRAEGVHHDHDHYREFCDCQTFLRVMHELCNFNGNLRPLKIRTSSILHWGSQEMR